jgi:hypothetical protein
MLGWLVLRLGVREPRHERKAAGLADI